MPPVWFFTVSMQESGRDSVADVVQPARAPQDVVGCSHGGAGADRGRMMTMAGVRTERQDWTFRAARRRMLRAGRTQLPLHVAVARMDEAANRIVDCRCGWSGNGLGWADHLDRVVRQALGPGSPA